MQTYTRSKRVGFVLVIILTIYTWFYYSSNRVAVTKTTVEQKNLKYILQWSPHYSIPFNEMKSDVTTFVERKCDCTNCFVTHNRSLLANVEDFDVILFHGPDLSRMKDQPELPPRRHPKQKYVFVSIESSHYYPMTSPKYQSFFNWTWTYRLDSDVPYAYITVRDSQGNTIGPSKDVKWLSQAEMDPVSKELETKLMSKKKAAAWMVSNCKALSKREVFVQKLQQELKKFDLQVDVYGKCGNLSCPTGDSKCLRMVRILITTNVQCNVCTSFDVSLNSL